MTIVIASLLLTTPVSAQTTSTNDLEAILQNSSFSHMSEIEKQEAKSTAIWTNNGTLGAFCYSLSCFLIKDFGADQKIIDISGTVAGNLGYFGSEAQYDRIENKPLLISHNETEIVAIWSNNIRALQGADQLDSYGVYIRTRIWKDGQRYTKSEPLILKNDMPIGR